MCCAVDPDSTSLPPSPLVFVGVHRPPHVRLSSGRGGMPRRRRRIHLSNRLMPTALYLTATLSTSTVSMHGLCCVMHLALCCHRCRDACNCEPHTWQSIPSVSAEQRAEHALRLKFVISEAPYFAQLVLNESVLFRYHVDERLVHICELCELLVTAAACIATYRTYGTAQSCQLHSHSLDLQHRQALSVNSGNTRNIAVMLAKQQSTPPTYAHELRRSLRCADLRSLFSQLRAVPVAPLVWQHHRPSKSTERSGMARHAPFSDMCSEQTVQRADGATWASRTRRRKHLKHRRISTVRL